MPEDPRRPRYAEVERGFYTGFEVGYLALFNTKTADTTKFPFAGAGGGTAGGMLVGAHAGYDLTDRFAFSVFGLGANPSGNASYGGFSLFAVGGDLRAALLKGSDANAVDRLFVYLHARAGYLVTSPSGLFGSTDTYLAGGPGVEYYTRLRHFSVGLAADAVYVLKAKTPGIAVMPTVRYTF